MSSYSVTVDCDSGNGYDGRLGLRISSVFVIGFGSMCGMFQRAILVIFTFQEQQLMLSHRCSPPHCGCSNKAHACSTLSILHHQVLRLGCYHSNSFHPCKPLKQACLSIILLLLISYSSLRRLPLLLARHVSLGLLPNTTGHKG
jgi:hypothetical protein